MSFSDAMHWAQRALDITTDRFDNIADWLAGGEERRIAYVSLTRAKSYSAVAVPNSCDPSHIAALEARGFRRLP